jgi:hypothetical protein
VLHGFSFANYLEELGPTAQQEIYKRSSIDLALRDAFRKMRAFLMNTKGLTEDEAISLISIGVDFGVTQVVDGNWGIHAVIKKSLFAGTPTAWGNEAIGGFCGRRLLEHHSRGHDRRPDRRPVMPQYQIDLQWVS